MLKPINDMTRTEIKSAVYKMLNWASFFTVVTKNQIYASNPTMSLTIENVKLQIPTEYHSRLAFHPVHPTAIGFDYVEVVIL